MSQKNLLLVSITILAFSISSCKKDVASDNTSPEILAKQPQQLGNMGYIVQLKQDNPALKNLSSKGEITDQKSYVTALAPIKSFAEDLLKKHYLSSVLVTQTYANSIVGFAATLTDEQAENLKSDPAILSIEKNVEIINKVEMAKPDATAVGSFIIGPNNTSSWRANPQITPTGIQAAKGFADGTGKTIFIVDSGVDPFHPDLNVDVSRSANFITLDLGNSLTFSNPGLFDFCGHGTAVAGCAAAKNNAYGVVGVAANATLVAVKVTRRGAFDNAVIDPGTGTIADIVAGIDYVASIASAGNVCNISIGSSSSSAFNAAVIRLAQVGVKVAVSAGNQGINVASVSPGNINYPGVYPVSAVNANGVFLNFSNFGSTIKFTQIGSQIITTLPVARIIFGIAGTSFSSPYVAGILALTNNPGNNGFAINDPDGVPDPIAARF